MSQSILSSVVLVGFFFSLFLLLFNYNCLHFLPSLHSTPANPTSLPHLNPPPSFCPCVLYSRSWKPFSPLSPPHSPLAIVTLFLISMSLVIFCLLFSFVDYVPVKGETIWYLSPTAWLIFLKDFIYLFVERGGRKEKESERNINVWLPLTCPLLGTWPETHAYALAGNQTSDPLICRPALSPLSHTIQAWFSWYLY